MSPPSVGMLEHLLNHPPAMRAPLPLMTWEHAFERQTYLHIASYYGSVKAMKYLLDRTDFKLVGCQLPRLPIHGATQSRKQSIRLKKLNFCLHFDYTGLHFLNFFKSQEGKLIILIAFFLLNTNMQTIFSKHVQISRNFMPKV